MEVRPIDANALQRRSIVMRFKVLAEKMRTVNQTKTVVYAEDIDNAPTLDYAPVRHGEWIEDDTPFAKQRKCSICGKRDNPKTAIRGHYCWYCGAKMDGGKERE